MACGFVPCRFECWWVRGFPESCDYCGDSKVNMAFGKEGVRARCQSFVDGEWGTEDREAEREKHWEQVLRRTKGQRREKRRRNTSKTSDIQ